MPHSSHIIAAIEMGTSKTVVLVGEILKNKRLNIIGFAESPSEGIKKGEIIDFKAASHSTHNAIAAAEKSAGASIERVYLAQTGAHLSGAFHSGTVNVSASNSVVRDVDIDRVTKEAKNKQLPHGRVYLHHIHNGFCLDDRRIAKPLGTEGQRLSVAYWSVHGDVQRLRDAIHIINGFGLNVEDVILSSLASASIVATEAEKQNGVCVIDIGAGTTDYVLYKDGFVAFTGVLPVGGDHLSNDLSLGLRIPYSRAEVLKREVGKAIIEPSDENETLWLMGEKSIGDRSISKRVLLRILEARVKEIFDIVESNLKPMLTGPLPGGIVLTGGTALLPRIAEAAESTFNSPVRLGENPPWIREDLQLPQYSTVTGLLNYALTGIATDNHSQKINSRNHWLHRFAKMLHLAN